MWWYRINYTVEVNLRQSLYEVMEDRGEVIITIELSQPSPKSFDIVIGLLNVTAECMW